MFAEIIIPLALPKNYTWSVPEQLLEQVRVGQRAEVGLGRNKKYAGIIKRLFKDKPAIPEIKDILNILDTEPVVTEEQLKLWEWIASYYMCSEGEVMAAALPAHFRLSSETILVFNEEYGEDFSMLDHDEYLVAEALLLKKELKLPEVQQILDDTHVYPVIRRIIDKRVCFVWEALKQTYSPKKETYVLLKPEYEQEEKLAELLNNWGRAPKQMELLLSYIHLLKTEGEVVKSTLLKKSQASDAQLKGLVDKGILWLQKREIDRLQYLPRNIQIDFSLSEQQQQAFDAINTAHASKQVCLLHGVTSSGKTNVYIKLIEQYIRQGLQVLYLLPEIALTSQIIRRLQNHFGGHVGVYHSKFNQNERIEIWNKVKTGELKVILGARSALFLPFSNLGLLLVDEEHDTSYKQQDPAPRYHARDAAVYYANLFSAKVLLGSATPSVESFFNAQSGKYGLATLTERYGAVPMPSIELVDTKPFIKKGEHQLITPVLQKAIEEALQKNQQVILFRNRRGYTPYQVCKLCGSIPKCRYCDVSLTYHKQSNKLQCHYCGTVYPPVITCAACGSHEFIRKNFGTEQVEELLEELFPSARIARMDIDSVRGKDAHDSLIRLFEEHRIDILVGTQMLVKGLDFEKVQLVGILDADSLLNFSDFRVNERAFQLMEQVSGRAGRKDQRGQVLVQVAETGHPVLHYLQTHDYINFYNQEIRERQAFQYPPFSRFMRISFRHRYTDIVQEASRFFAERLQSGYAQFMIGPAEPVVNRVRNQYIMELSLKLPRDAGIQKNCKDLIRNAIAQLHFEKRFRSVLVLPDVDAV